MGARPCSWKARADAACPFCPRLDDRSFDDLVEDLLARIPAHTPEWTNPRLGDPGRTLIELFAWLGDTLLYRANLIPERQRLVFLRLLGMPLQPARPARGIVSLAFAQPTERRAATLAPGARINGPVAVRDAGRDHGAAGHRRGLHQAHADRRGGDAQAGELLDGLRAHPPPQRRRQGLRDHAGVRRRRAPSRRASTCSPPAPTARCGSRCSRRRRRSRSSSRRSTTRCARRSAAATPARRRCSRRRRARARRCRRCSRRSARRAPVPVLWEITTRGRDAARDRLPDARGAGRQRHHRRADAAAACCGWRCPTSRSSGRRPTTSARTLRAGVGDAPPRLDDADKARAPDRLAAAAAASRHSRSTPAADLGRHQRGRDRSAHDRRPGACSACPPAPPTRCSSCRSGSVEPATLQIEVEEPGRGYQPWSASTISRRSAPTRASRARRRVRARRRSRHAALRRRRARPHARAADARPPGHAAASAAAAPATCRPAALTEIAAPRIDGSAGAGAEGRAAARHRRAARTPRRWREARAAHPVASAPPRARGDRRRLSRARVRDAGRRRRPRRGAAALQAARPPLRRAGRGLA